MWHEFQLRNLVLTEALKILSDGTRWKSRQITAEINALGINVKKSLINSVLFSEGRRYVTYDRKSFTYRLKDQFIGSATKQVSEVNSIFYPPPRNTISIDQELQYSFETMKLDTPAFFTTEVRGGNIDITINREHPISGMINSVSCNSQVERESTDCKLKTAEDCIEVMLKGWAEYENDQPYGKRKTVVQDARIDWGRKIRDLLMDSEGSQVTA